MKNLVLRACLATSLCAATAAQAVEPVRIGFITTLSTPAGYLGEDSRDGFQLAIDQEDGKLGGVPVQLIVEDDGLQPAKAKQIADRMSLDGISLYTGVIFSNVLAAVINTATKDGFYVSNNTAPSTLAGEKCMANYFVGLLPERHPARDGRCRRQRAGLQEDGDPGAQLSGRP